MANINLPYNWTPRPYQEPLWNYLHNGGLRAVQQWHRRSGKDDVDINYTACASHERKGNYWYMLPEYAQARKSMWDAINPHTGIKRIDQAIPHEVRQSINNQEMKITLRCGSTFQLVGSDNFNSLVGSPPVGLIFSEYAISNPSAWAYLMPILEENGGWAIFNSTPRGKNHFYRTVLMAQDNHDWFYDKRTALDTDIFTADQLERIRGELYSLYGQEFGEAMFQQEYFVSFDAAQIGAIWADCIAKLQMQGRIGDFPHNPEYPVHCSYDIGKTDSTAIWFFQVIGQDIYVIDHHESNHKNLDFYFTMLRGKTNEHGYKYSTQWLPHDAFHDTLSNGGKTVRQQFIDNGQDGLLGKVKRTPNSSREGGIQAARATFPRCYFNERTTEDGIEALKSYHHKWDDDKKIFSDQPEHDWSSDSADSFRYLSLVWKEARAEPDSQSIEESLKRGNIVAITMKSLTQQHFNKMRAARKR